MLEAEGLTQYYGDRAAIRDVSLRVAEGETVGFLGPNGAGKSTTLRILAGFLSPTAGRVRVAGYDLAADPLEARRRLGYLPESNPLYKDMRVEEFLRYRARLKGIDRSRISGEVGRALERCAVRDASARIIGQLSKGFRQRVGLADCLLGDPPFLLLDEPTVGLDPNQVAETRSLIREIGRERAILFSSHILHEVEQLCRRVLILREGRILAEGAPAELAERHAPARELVVQLFAEGDPLPALGAVPGVEAVAEAARTPEGARELRLRIARDADPRCPIAALAAAKGWILQEIRLEPVRLEDLFSRLTLGPEAA